MLAAISAFGNKFSMIYVWCHSDLKFITVLVSTPDTKTTLSQIWNNIRKIPHIILSIAPTLRSMLHQHFANINTMSFWHN